MPLLPCDQVTPTRISAPDSLASLHEERKYLSNGRSTPGNSPSYAQRYSPELGVFIIRARSRAPPIDPHYN